MSKRLRCAIYTRKSTEEGLDQQFNSLHAQREACEAYVLSQTGEGWAALKTHYDDGGFSGGSMERPALKALMEDIRKGHVDIVVVYKVDRLTRSLADFAKIVELFDQQGVSFVSVTQAFNTTTSMGRLTLNVLLSFAQFEREVTGERIRDKIAASKAKGLRMGGNPPLGYDIKDGRLAINAAEAAIVRRIFERYAASGSMRSLMAELSRDGVTSKRRLTKKGKVVGGGAFTRGPLYYLLTNPAYLGVTRHKEKRYPDTHPAIIDEALWDRVQAQFRDTNARRPASPKRSDAPLLKGVLFDDRGDEMVATHTVKGNRRYRYYASRNVVEGRAPKDGVRRISAGIIEQVLVEQLPAKLASAWAPEADAAERVRSALHRVAIATDAFVAQLKPEAARSDTEIRIPYRLRVRKGGLAPVSGSAGSNGRLDRALVRALVRARDWMKQVEAGEVGSVKALAEQEGLCLRHTTKMLPLAYLAPDLTAVILEGRQPRDLTLGMLIATPLPLAWERQRAWFARLV